MGKFGFDVQGWTMFGALVGFVSFVLGKAISAVGGFSIDFATVSVAESRGQFSAIGEQLVKLGPFSPGGDILMGLITSIVAGIVVVLVGRTFIGFIPVDSFFGTRTVGKKVAAVLVVGVLALTLLLVQSGLPGLTTGIALVIWALVLSWIMVTLAGRKEVPIKIPQN